MPKRETGVTACIACHGPKGEGVPLAGFPALASQHAAYISKQLKLFRQHSINIQTGESKSSRVNDYDSTVNDLFSPSSVRNEVFILL
jgi:cytochrome c553